MIGIEKELAEFKDYFGKSPKLGDEILIASKLYFYKGFVSGVSGYGRISLSNTNPIGFKPQNINGIRPPYTWSYTVKEFNSGCIIVTKNDSK